ncbi:hypothetical protein B0T25DRAFT_254501 [Lasiosphaeria hispida]|uniref:Uncharacterized protein n=1 Tax=Lasiosphaeria hispida TaxID=260671 RepID=A0AAJ0MCU0_9PEZI|nr:hypothetical protein B0T25DRAFT_254501 [Lasiosphaeria hispida]
MIKSLLNLLGGVESTGSPEIKGMEEGPHYPDASFAHKDAEKYGVIVEVANSQKRRDLKYLADDYILGSRGLTQLVIGIDLEYPQNKGKEARVIVWRPRYVEEDGEMLKRVKRKRGASFGLQMGVWSMAKRCSVTGLRTLGTGTIVLGDDIPGEITISFSELYNTAQQSDIITEKRDGEQDNSRYPIPKCRKRDRTPPERLSSPDKKRFKAAEEEVNKRLDDQDSDYEPEEEAVDAKANPEGACTIAPATRGSTTGGEG